MLFLDRLGGPEEHQHLSHLNERTRGLRGRRKQSRSASGLWSMGLFRSASLSTSRTAASTLLIEPFDKLRRRRSWLWPVRGSV